MPSPEARMRIFQLEFTNISAHWPLLSLKIRQGLDPQGPFPLSTTVYDRSPPPLINIAVKFPTVPMPNSLLFPRHGLKSFLSSDNDSKPHLLKSFLGTKCVAYYMTQI